MEGVPQNPNENIQLSIPNEDLKALLCYFCYKEASDKTSLLQWKHLEVFFTSLSRGSQKHGGTHFSIPYNECKFAVDLMLSVSLNNFEKIEEQLEKLKKAELMQEEVKNEEGQAPAEEQKELEVIEEKESEVPHFF